MPRSDGYWKKGQSGNPKGRPRVPPEEMAYGRRLRMALLHQSQVPIPPKPDECNENSNGNGNGNGEKPKSVKVRYETYEEVRAALLEEGINVDQLPMLEDMRPPEERN
jgi:Family of unknown function (DUF5681)